jgi:hypothetical protein
VNADCPADSVAGAFVTCRPAAGACDVAETCDGATTICPADALAVDGTSCDDGDACTAVDQCQAGVCTSAGDACGADDALCYRVRATTRFTKRFGLPLADQFGGQLYDVIGLRTVCNAADVDGNGVADPNDHATIYRMRPTPGQPPFATRTLTLQNAIGTLTLNVSKPNLLVLPAAFGSTPPSGGAAYTCYKTQVAMGAPHFAAVTVTVADAFTATKSLVLTRPTVLCAASSVNGGPVENPAALLLCYGARPAPAQPKHVRVNGLKVADAFGQMTVNTRKETDVCVPTTIVP